MATDPAADVVRWVQEGERLFGQALQTLQQVEMLTKQNQQLREEIQAMREEVDSLRAERLEAAETLKTFAEHVTQVATLALQRLGRRAG